LLASELYFNVGTSVAKNENMVKGVLKTNKKTLLHAYNQSSLKI
jgi:hypothetical protein